MVEQLKLELLDRVSELFVVSSLVLLVLLLGEQRGNGARDLLKELLYKG